MAEGVLTRREYLYVLWAGAAIAVLGSAIGISYWYLQPARDPVPLGHIAEVSRKLPLYLPISSDLAVYLVELDGEYFAWDAISPRSKCRFSWVSINNRFEDPCSGEKWCMDGTIADRRFRDATTLFMYEIDILADGQMMLHPWNRVQGEPLPADSWISDPIAIAEATVHCPGQ